MPTTYQDGNFAVAAQNGDVIVERPLFEEGDPSALVIVRPMMVNRANYTPVSIGTALAGFAGSRFLFDRNYRDVTNDVMAYESVYATVPADRNGVFSGSNSYPFPAYRGVAYTPPATAEAANDDDNLWRFVELRGANSAPAPLYIDHKYFVQASPPTIPAVFRPNWNGAAVDFVTDGGSGIFSNSTALNGETFSGSYSVPASSPTLTAYAASVTAGDMLVVDVQIERYIGDIFVMKTLKMKAQ